jgi:hypothetical protein
MSVNRNVPPIANPIADLNALAVVAVQLRQGVQSLSGQTGGPLERAVTLADLVQLGLISEAEIMVRLR